MQMAEKVCSICLMDTSVPDISFDEYGICNYCKLHSHLDMKYPLTREGNDTFLRIIEDIKASGRNKKYDCIIGVSGGTDSSYSLLISKQMGLRPLAVHFDNGWNSEIAVHNIENAVRKLKIDLYTYVVDWEEFRDLQLSFLKASVPEVELPTDMAIRSVLYRTAAAEKVKYIIEGTSFRTEGIIPHGWAYKDGRYIKSIQKINGTYKLKTFPNLTLFDYFKYAIIKKIQLFRILNYIDYSKEEAKKVLAEKLSWKDYGGHHHESYYTKYFQAYLAVNKFNMDRRKISLSALIRENKISRDDALERISKDYYSSEQLKDDMEYIAKKFNLSFAEFEKIISSAPKSFFDYPSYYPLLSRLNFLIKAASRLNLLQGGFQAGQLSFEKRRT